MKKIKVIFYGVGAIGSEVAKFGLTRPWLEVVFLPHPKHVSDEPIWSPILAA